MGGRITTIYCLAWCLPAVWLEERAGITRSYVVYILEELFQCFTER